MKPDEQKDVYDFYRCYQCGRLITKLEEAAAFERLNQEVKALNHGAGMKHNNSVCPCGSCRYQPTNILLKH